LKNKELKLRNLEQFLMTSFGRQSVFVHGQRPEPSDGSRRRTESPAVRTTGFVHYSRSKRPTSRPRRQNHRLL